MGIWCLYEFVPSICKCIRTLHPFAFSRPLLFMQVCRYAEFGVMASGRHCVSAAGVLLYSDSFLRAFLRGDLFARLHPISVPDALGVRYRKDRGSL